MEPLAINPRRLFRGTGATVAVANNFVGLYNASQGDRLLVLFGYTLACQTTTQTGAFGFQGSAGAKAMNGVPVLLGEGSGSGQIFSGTNPAGVVVDFRSYFLGNTSLPWLNKIPFAVIPPGWMLGFTNGSTAVGTTVSFLWQEMLPDELLSIPG